MERRRRGGRGIDRLRGAWPLVRCRCAGRNRACSRRFAFISAQPLRSMVRSSVGRPCLLSFSGVQPRRSPRASTECGRASVCVRQVISAASSVAAGQYGMRARFRQCPPVFSVGSVGHAFAFILHVWCWAPSVLQLPPRVQPRRSIGVQLRRSCIAFRFCPVAAGH